MGYTEKIYSDIVEKNLIQKGDIVIIATSGGADSMALLHVLCELREKLDIDIVACHVHHGIRGLEADEDANFVEEYCKNKGLRFELFREDIYSVAKEFNLSVEEAGRLKRYQNFELLKQRIEVATGKKVKIAVAHNKEDNAETVLMQLFRGSGLKGLGGISTKRGDIIRPLLDVSRGDIENILEEAGLSYRTDSTNLCDEYTRNIVRHKIIPVIRKDINASGVDNIIRSAEFIKKADDFITGEALKLKEQSFIYTEGELSGLNTTELECKDEILRSYVLRMFIAELIDRLKDIEAVHIAMFDKLLYAETGKSINLPYGLVFYKSYDKILKESFDKASNKEKNFEEYFETEKLDNKSLKIDNLIHTKYVDYGKIKGTLSFRTRKLGDYIHIKSGRKSIKAFMTDEKIPAKERDTIPLVAVENDIVWIVGKRLSEKYKISEETKEVLRITYKKGLL
jgi:tRNA(ile)-lysidine synthetase